MTINSAILLYKNTVNNHMILYIAEKPSLGRAIAEVLPKPQQKENGFIRLANGDIISWCIGHLLEQAEPEHYNPQFKRWQADHLPIVPEKWKLTVRKSAERQFTILKKLIQNADQLVHAGDPDREGQLLVDEVLAFCGVTGNRLANAQRLLISDLNPPAVRKALSKLTLNTAFIPLSTSALARSRADWLYGLNMTRAYTLQGQKAGFRGVLSVGRVQTPLLGLVVRRDAAIADFVSKPFYQVLAHLNTDDDKTFSALWQPSEACRPYQDEEGRVLIKALAEQVQRKITGQSATVTSLETQEKKQAPPLPYNLSALQIDAARRFGMSAQHVLDSCQQLYETHKLITYPRSDCRFLPEEQHNDAGSLLGAIAANTSELANACNLANLRLRSKAWNNTKITAHHAIIPTAKQLSLARLSMTEQRLYLLIARQYLAQFYPDYRYSETKVDLTISNGLFRVKAKVEVLAGWKQIYRNESAQPAVEKQPEQSAEHLISSLPPLHIGQILRCVDADVLEKNTQPPQHFTDATLLAAMTGISRYVQDETIRKTLRETDGLGTEATRASIIELLFKRRYLQRQGKQILATDTGKALIKTLPEQASLPDMTAHWESALNRICQREISYNAFMQPLMTELQQMIEQAATVSIEGLPTQHQRQRKSMPYRKKHSSRSKSSANKTAVKRN